LKFDISIVRISSFSDKVQSLIGAPIHHAHCRVAVPDAQ